MIKYIKKMLKQNEIVKIHLINGSLVSVVHVKKVWMNGKFLIIDANNTEHLIDSRYIVQIES